MPGRLVFEGPGWGSKCALSSCCTSGSGVDMMRDTKEAGIVSSQPLLSLNDQSKSDSTVYQKLAASKCLSFCC